VTTPRRTGRSVAVLGQNVQGVWFVLDRDGDPVKK
jgi:hypothetical protein